MRGPYKPKKVNHSEYYEVALTGSRAVGWMMTIYTKMGKRRKGTIKSRINSWKLVPVKGFAISRLWKKSKHDRLVEQGLAIAESLYS